VLHTPKQAEYLREAHHRWNFKGGATRSGKTYMDYRWIIPMRIRERSGLAGLNVILGVTKSTIERNVLQPMRELYGPALVGEINSENIVILFGEQVYALGAEKVSQVSKLRGASIKYCYGDEVADWSPEVFDLLKSRLDKVYSCFDGTYNPGAPGHWLQKFLGSDADLFSQVYTLDDNPFLPPEFVTNLKKEYAGTALYGRYVLGQWTASDGALFTVYPPRTSDATKLYEGIAHIDAAFGGADGSALTCGKLDGGKLYLFGRLRQQHIDTLTDLFRADCARLRCSPLLIESNADKGFVAKELHRAGEIVRMYDEHENKFKKIATHLRKWWKNVVILDGTDQAYIDQIMAYAEGAAHDDAPDSAACVARYFDARITEPYSSPFGD
jgi:hypothetical protein